MSRIDCVSAAACQRLAEEQASAVETAVPIVVGVVVGFILLANATRLYKERNSL